MPLKQNVPFKAITGGQALLFPPSLDDLVQENHPVRLVSSVVDRLNIDPILESYKGGGSSSFHPRIMIKVLFYSYLNNIYSCRKIAAALEENVHFMWISGNSRPDFRTINLFRSSRLKGHIQTLFAEVIRLMSEMGYVSLDIQFVDGTKIESVANRYTFVWRKSVEKRKEVLENKIRVVLSQIEQSINKDSSEPEENLIPDKIDKQELENKIKEINKRLQGDKNAPKELKKQVKELEKSSEKLDSYQQDLEKMGDRNSYSKTDEDATFMRMKDDHLGTGQLRPGYNVQISSENQIVTCFSVHQNAGDSTTLPIHLQQFETLYGKAGKTLVADAGYGSEENYMLLETKGMEAYVKYNTFFREQKSAHKQNPFHPDNLYYNPEADFYVCPMGQHMYNVGSHRRSSTTGYKSNVDVYEAINCNGCPLRSGCFKAAGNRSIDRNNNLIRLKKQAKELLDSQQGKQYRLRRNIEPESVFGQLKSNNRFSRFRMIGIPKIEIDLGLAIIGHNLRKMMAKICPEFRFSGPKRSLSAQAESLCFFLNLTISTLWKLVRKSSCQITFQLQFLNSEPRYTVMCWYSY
jgi:transposase